MKTRQIIRRVGHVGPTNVSPFGDYDQLVLESSRVVDGDGEVVPGSQSSRVYLRSSGKKIEAGREWPLGPGEAWDVLSTYFVQDPRVTSERVG